MPNRHKYRLMRPHSKLVDLLPGEYPDSVNIALERYLQLVSNPPEFTEGEWNVLCDVWNGMLNDDQSPQTLGQSLLLEVGDAIAIRAVDKKWQVNGDALISKLQALSNVEIIATIHSIERYWENDDEVEAEVVENKNDETQIQKQRLRGLLEAEIKRLGADSLRVIESEDSPDGLEIEDKSDGWESLGLDVNATLLNWRGLRDKTGSHKALQNLVDSDWSSELNRNPGIG